MMLPTIWGRGRAAAALDEGVQVVLRGQGVRHAHVLPEQPDPTDPPVAAGLGELMGVQREVRTVETADADVEDARLEPAAVVGRHGDTPRGDRRAAPRRTAGSRGADRLRLTRAR